MCVCIRLVIRPSCALRAGVWPEHWRLHRRFKEIHFAEENHHFFGAIMAQISSVLLVRSKNWWNSLNLRKLKGKSPLSARCRTHTGSSSLNTHYTLLHSEKQPWRASSHTYVVVGNVKLTFEELTSHLHRYASAGSGSASSGLPIK